MSGASSLVQAISPDPAVARHPDLVKRDFTATEPNQLWMTDLTFVPTAPTSAAVASHVCFIIDTCSRMIVGWRVASNMSTEMVVHAIEMARWSRGTRHALDGAMTISTEIGPAGGGNGSR